jgi:hypothetical protein
MKSWAMVFALLAPLSAQEVSLDAAAQEVVDIQQAHYAAVEAELRAAPVDRLTPAEQAARAWALDALDCYLRGREYGVSLGDSEASEAKVPWVRDPHGRLCAVAHMAWASGDHELVDRLAATRNNEWAVGLLEDPGLVAWAQRMGLTLLEVERIHAPSLHVTPSAPTISPLGAARAANLRSRNSEARAAPAASGGPRGATGAPASAGLPPARAATGDPSDSIRTGGSDLDAITGGAEMQDWWLWWEINKSAFLLEPRASAPGVGASGTGGASDLLRQLRASALPLLSQALQSGQANVRAAAATSLGRLGGEQAVSALLPALGDPVEEVREAALLALGATAAPRAADVLLAI